MIDLQKILKSIDKLSIEEIKLVWERLKQRTDELRRVEAAASNGNGVATWMSSINTAITAIRGGLTEQEIQDMVEAMNASYTDMGDLHLFTWMPGQEVEYPRSHNLPAS